MGFFKSLVGAAIGFVVGGPTGAAAGFSLGMQADAYTQQKKGIEQQRQANVAAAAATEREYAAQAQRAEIQNVRAVRQQLRQQYAAVGTLIGRGATTGTLGSSGVEGGVGSLGAQLAGNLSYMSDIADTQTESAAAARDLGQAKLQMGEAQATIAKAQAFDALGKTIFSAAGGPKAFGGPKTTNVG